MKTLKVLLVEDSQLKFDSINRWVSRCGDVEIVHKNSRNGAMLEILMAEKKGEPFDLLITDMQIPLFEDDFDHMMDDGGREIIDELEYRDINIPYVVCSSAVNEGDFPNALKVIKYEYCVSYWSTFEQIIQTVRDGGKKENEE